jgi:hypothetical protein
MGQDKTKRSPNDRSASSTPDPVSQVAVNLNGAGQSALGGLSDGAAPANTISQGSGGPARAICRGWSSYAFTQGLTSQQNKELEAPNIS